MPIVIRLRTRYEWCQMTVAEFNAEFARCQRKMIVRMVYAIGIMFVALAIAGGVPYFDRNLADIATPFIIFAIGFPAMLFGFYRVDRVYREFPSMICPHCDGNLARSKSVTIATGNCPNCGRRVLHDTSIGQ